MSMKKIVCVLLAVLAVLGSMSAALADPAEWIGKEFPDFTVKSVNNGTFTLSESLETHELVVVNFWATWCPPCKAEFPYLEKAWGKYKSKVDVIALSVEPKDTLHVLKDFLRKNKLTFSVASDKENLFAKLSSQYIPTTLIIGKGRIVLAAEVGGKPSVEAFTDWFDKFLK